MQRGIETEFIEFKSRFSDEVIESLTAFANTKGGKVYVGVKDDGTPVKNFTIGKETIRECLNEIKNKTQPTIIPDAHIVNYQGNEIIEFSVPEFPIKPVACRGRYFKRIKNSNHQLSPVEIADTYMQSMQYSWDSYPYNGANVGNLNKGKIKTFIAKVNSVGRFQLPKSPEAALQKLGMLKDNIPTNAAMILFSKENLLHNVHIGRFKTPSLIIADKMINGNLYDVVEESMQTITGHLKFAFEITGKTTQRTEIPEYPLEAIREALLNAMIHRDYRNPSDVQIKIFDQQIVFFNPGGLYGNITEKELYTDIYRASIRNKQLAEAFYLTHDIEKYGSGFIRIRDAIRNYPTMIFDFRNLGDGFELKFSYTEQKISTRQIKSANVTDFTGNVTDISKNVTDVIDNVTNISKNVTDNVTDISKNVTDISKNVTDVTDNVTDISKNVTDVTDNVTDISKNVTDVTDNVTDDFENVTDISENVTDISKNVTDVTDNVTDISENFTNI
ncbi:MAG: putative DNA binding domain-containing protein [Prevotellaceae bacterium]|jgi:ATP-dependent DNA helicase RecG|nr:putative DNA binding domain-containing protein [Prevotellaceae bacterium]